MIVVRKDARKPGTEVGRRFAQMVEFVQKNRGATLAQVLAATDYEESNAAVDLTRGNIRLEDD